MLPSPSSAQAYQPIMTFPSVHDINHLYFVTASIAGWKRLLAEPKYMQIILDSLTWLQNEKRILLFAFVIMPSHLHLILKPESKTIGEVLQNFGSYTAHAILSELRGDKRDDLMPPRAAARATNLYAPCIVHLWLLFKITRAQPDLIKKRCSSFFHACCGIEVKRG